jgi:glucokinase
MHQTPLFLGVDVGGQSIKAGVVDDTGKPLSSVDVPTEAFKGQEHGLRQMVRAAEKAVAAARLAMTDIAGIGVATPGLMDIHAGLIIDPPNLRPWKNVPVRQFVQDATGRLTTFQNDANAAAYGEYWVGAGRGCKSMVLFTLGTGIGGGIILDDIIVEGAHSHGAELGHIVIQMNDGRMCGCGYPGHLEAYASARSIVKRTREALAATKEASLLRSLLQQEQIATSGKVLSEAEEETLDARFAGQIFQLAEVGDALAKKLVDETAYYLAVGAACLMHTINPEMVIFGGGMIAAGPTFLSRIQTHIKKLAFPIPAERTIIRYAELGPNAGFIGAAGCARRAMLRK